MTRIACIIPARLESSRMPRKLLRDETGWPLVNETILAAANASIALKQSGKNWFSGGIYVATDSHDIAAFLPAASEALMTGKCNSGTDRIAEAIKDTSLQTCDLIVNIQADEPEIQPEHIRALIDAALMVPGCDMATLAAPLKPNERDKPNVVKVTVDKQRGFATKFSRESWTHGWSDDSWKGLGLEELHHLGVYAYTPRFLKWFTSLPQSDGEKRKHLEQLRALDNGARIRVAVVPEAWPGIDTEEEYQAFVKRYKERENAQTI